MPVSSIDVTIEQNKPAVMVLELAMVEEIALLDADSAGNGFEFQQSGTGLIAGRGKHKISCDDWCGYVGDIVGDSVIAP